MSTEPTTAEPTPVPAPADPPAAASTDKASERRKRKREKEKANKAAAVAAAVPEEKKPAAKKAKTSNDAQNKPSVTAAVGGVGGDKKPKAKKPKKEGEGEGAKKGQAKKPLEKEELNADVAMMEPRLAADYYVQKLKRHEKEISAVEVEDRRIPEAAFLDTTTYQKPRILSNYPEFFSTFHPADSTIPLNGASDTPGSPHTIILTSSAIRATHVIRAIRPLNPDPKAIIVGKLFSKHIKMAEAIETCEKQRMGFGVGTPGRVVELLKQGCLKTEALRWVVLDLSAKDTKGMGMLEVKEIMKAVVEVMGVEGVRERIKGGETRVLIY